MYDDNDSDDLDFGDSEDNRAESSEDELEILLHSSPEQRRQLQHRKADKSVDHEDDFEREMNAELQDTVAAIEAERDQSHRSVPSNSETQSASGAQKSKEQEESTSKSEFYDDVYFDSDEDESKDSSQNNKKRRIPTNDDLLYDPNMDEEDEKWVARQRQKYCSPNKQKKPGQHRQQAEPRSDAILDCPACMTTLCRDCQRHDQYEHQYRAMFVSNCVVDRSELLKFPEQKSKKKKKKEKNSNSTPNDDESDKYHPVKCEECDTVVAMFDKDEVYHFFNVLASY